MKIFLRTFYIGLLLAGTGPWLSSCTVLDTVSDAAGKAVLATGYRPHDEYGRPLDVRQNQNAKPLTDEHEKEAREAHEKMQQQTFDKFVLIDETSAPFLYESRAAHPASMADLIRIVDPDLENETNEFKQREALQKDKEAVPQKLEWARNVKYVMVKIYAGLGQYNFARHLFPTTITPKTFVSFSYDFPHKYYGAFFDNEKDIESIPMNQEGAERLVSKYQYERNNLAFILYGELRGIHTNDVIENEDDRTRAQRLSKTPVRSSADLFYRAQIKKVPVPVNLVAMHVTSFEIRAEYENGRSYETVEYINLK